MFQLFIRDKYRYLAVTAPIESEIILDFRRYVITHSAFHSQTHPVAEIVLGQDAFDSGNCPSCKPAQKFPIAPQDVVVHPDYKIEEMLKSGNEVLLVRLPQAAVTYLEDKQVPSGVLTLNQDLTQLILEIKMPLHP